MNAVSARERVNRSRLHLEHLSARVSLGAILADSLPMLDREIALLEDIARHHPSEAQDIIPLLVGWLQLRMRIRARLN